MNSFSHNRRVLATFVPVPPHIQREHCTASKVWKPRFVKPSSARFHARTFDKPGFVKPSSTGVDVRTCLSNLSILNAIILASERKDVCDNENAAPQKIIE